MSVGLHPVIPNGKRHHNETRVVMEEVIQPNLYLAQRLKRKMLQMAETPSFQPIFLPSA
jgi:hypothetical protein